MAVFVIKSERDIFKVAQLCTQCGLGYDRKRESVFSIAAAATTGTIATIVDSNFSAESTSALCLLNCLILIS